jgi:pilus assembly protein Flp/PilA
MDGRSSSMNHRSAFRMMNAKMSRSAHCRGRVRDRHSSQRTEQRGEPAAAAIANCGPRGPADIHVEFRRGVNSRMIQILSTYVEYGLRKVTENMEDETGQTLVEYGLILLLISITLLAVLGAVSGALNGVFNKVSTTLGGSTA